MASALSEEEFHRMQLQLLELRTNNYELDSKCKRQEREYFGLKEKYEECEKELQRAYKAINKSKRAKDVEILIQENDALQRKLQSQEDEFRLQNETLMQELSHLVASNEAFEKRLNTSNDKKEEQATTSVSKTEVAELGDEVRRLQALNVALQKNLKGCQDRYEKQLLSLKQQLKLNGSSTSSTPPQEENDNHQVDGGSGISPQLSSDENFHDCQDTLGEDILNNEKLQNILQSPSKEDYIKDLNALRLNLDTELEENRILKEQLINTEKKFQSQVISLEEEIEKLTEKLKKKQESYVHLQEEKEHYFKEAESKLEQLQSARDRDQKYYCDHINKLQTELESKRQALDTSQHSATLRIKELEDLVITLQQQVDATNIVNTQQLDDMEQKYRQKINALETQLAAQAQQLDDYKVQLQESQRASEHTLEMLYAAQQERDTQIQSLQEISKVAEKRKCLLDDLAIKYQKECDSHRELVQQMTQDHEAEINKLEDMLSQERENSMEVEKLRATLEEIQGQLVSTEETKGWLERRLDEAEANLNTSKQEFEQTLTKVKELSHKEKDDMLGEFQKEIEEYKQKETKQLNEIRQLNENIEKLQQEIKDGIDDKKIHEKKGLTMLKDLKRQLHAERKRAEKLQERLQEVLSDPKSRHGVDELFKPVDASDRAESSSVSSWSAGASGIGTKDSPQSPNRAGSPPSDFESEHDDLLNRLATSQQQKWTLEEKVQHLEESNAAMCEDLLQKTAIIEYYVMDGRSDHLPAHKSNDDKLSLKKVLDLVNRGDVNMKEMNRKLQRMLEETLTKNMHLQKDLETLSQEVVRLSKTQTLASTPMSDSDGDISIPTQEKAAPPPPLNKCNNAILAQ